MLCAVLLGSCGDADEAAMRGTGDRTPMSQIVFEASVTQPASPASSPTVDMRGSPTVDLGICGQTSEADLIDHPTDADEVILRIERSFPSPPMPGMGLMHAHDLSLYGDGTLITTAPGMIQYADPAAIILTEDGIQQLLRYARSVGLMVGDVEYFSGQMFRPTYVKFTVNVAGETHVVEATNLERTDDLAELTDAEREARARLLPFLECTLWMSRRGFPKPPSRHPQRHICSIACSSASSLEDRRTRS